MMDLRDLRAFVTLAELLHFGQAATRLHLTQSALSKQIRRLEGTWGGALFERSAAATRLTPLGEALLADAERLLDDARTLDRKARDVVAGVAGVLRIGFGVASKDIVPRAIARFRELRPDVRVELLDLSTHHQIQLLQSGRLDLGFCRLPAPSGWPVLPVAEACFVAVVPQAWGVGGTLADFARHPLATVARAGAPAFYDHLMSYFAGTGVRVSELQTVSDFASAVALAASGVAWAIVPSSTAIDQPLVRAEPLSAAEAGWQVGLMRPPGEPGPFVKVFWQVAERLCDSVR